ncbi:MAG TPA: SURF1 family protein [Anaerolineales bacterium]|nr:SURF1 family protein [Anaerolineales bacterium]
MFLRKMFQRKWLLTTLLVLAGTALCIRLGIWQLDRLEQRRTFNAHVDWARSQPILDLNQELPEDIVEMEWRAVQVQGEYDFANQIAVRNQYRSDQYGYHLLTPLRFGGQAVLVDRGWIPADGNSAASDWRKYDEAGTVDISGQIRLGRTKPAFGGVADPLPENGAALEVWNNADLTRIAGQVPYPILPVYIQPQPDADDSVPPIPFQPEIELTEGSHFGYALQWFTFATILFLGYPFYLRKQEADAK